MRDVLGIARVRQREALPRLLHQLAAQTGQMLNISKAGQAVGLESSIGTVTRPCWRRPS